VTVISRGDTATSVLDAAEALRQRRERAIMEAKAAAREQLDVCEPDAWLPGLATCRYHRGCLVVALAGAFDRAGVEQLRALRGEITRHADTELILELGALTTCSPGLARLLGQLRIAALTRGARVQLRDAPEVLRAKLGPEPAEVFTVHDDPAPASDCYGV
jgi:hypothetical protein